eukprot:scaffold70995_cov60-Phaeocystis_antarctica.AAC.4
MGQRAVGMGIGPWGVSVGQWAVGSGYWVLGVGIERGSHLGIRPARTDGRRALAAAPRPPGQSAAAARAECRCPHPRGTAPT